MLIFQKIYDNIELTGRNFLKVLFWSPKLPFLELCSLQHWWMTTNIDCPKKELVMAMLKSNAFWKVKQQWVTVAQPKWHMVFPIQKFFSIAQLLHGAWTALSTNLLSNDLKKEKSDDRHFVWRVSSFIDYKLESTFYKMSIWIKNNLKCCWNISKDRSGKLFSNFGHQCSKDFCLGNFLGITLLHGSYSSWREGVRFKFTFHRFW